MCAGGDGVARCSMSEVTGSANGLFIPRCEEDDDDDGCCCDLEKGSLW